MKRILTDRTPEVHRLAEVFWSRVDKSGDCWIWRGPKCPLGYGRVRSGRLGQTSAHRFMMVLMLGHIPADREVCHNCPGGDNPSCVNPDHLYIGTHADNMRDAGKKGQMASGPRHHWHGSKHLSGERSPIARLTWAAVADIRRRSGTVGVCALAREYGVAPPTICDVIARRTWKHEPAHGEAA